MGITQKIKIEKQYLNTLFAALLVELTGVVIGWPNRVDFFSDTQAPVAPANHIYTEENFPGTSWTFRENTNPTLRFIMLQINRIFTVNSDRPEDTQIWYLNGSNITIKLKSGDSIYKGKILDDATIEGTYTNTQTHTFGKWKAQRLK